MRHQQQGDVGRGELLLQLLDHVEVEVVGGLVHDEHIGHVDEHLGHSEALLLSAAEGVHGLLEVAQAELEEEALHAGLVVPGVQLGHLFDGAVEGVAVEVLRYGVLVGADGVGDGVVAVQHLVHEAVGRGHLHVLVEVADAEALVEADDARVRRLQPGDAFQQGALAGAVACNDGGLLAFFKSEGDVLKKLAWAIALTDALNGKAVHGRGPICGARRYGECSRESFSRES